jgi:hypothetical protein
MNKSDVMSASYQPGFSPDLTYWQVFIGRNRWLRQKVVIGDRDSELHNQVLWFRAKLSRQQMAELWATVARVGFREFNRHYAHETMCRTDCPSYIITVRFDDRLKEVEAYDMPRLAELKRQPAAVGFQELWEAITAHAPYGKVPMERGLPRPWWRIW